MKDGYISRLKALVRAGEQKKIIDALLEIPEEEREYRELAPFLSTYLLYTLHGNFEVEDVVQEEQGCVMIPEWKVAVTPQVGQVSHRSVVLHFYLYFPEWGRTIYECSAGMGNDLKQAFGMAVSSFLFSLMDGIGAMVGKDSPRLIETEFAGKPHRFEVYLSNIVGMGQSPRTAPDLYWEALKEDIMERLGNQTFCFVKIYGAKGNGQVTGECRIDDVKSDALSAKVAELVKDWDAGQFASHKQFILISQQEETILPYPYSGPEGQERFREAVLKAAAMFHEADTQELYDSLSVRLAQEIGDVTLAQECCTFLPEICAQNAFEEVSYSETLEILRGEGEPVTCYKSQLADYWPMWDVLSTAFQERLFGEDTDKIYEEYISVSSTYDVIQKAQEKGSQLDKLRLTSLLCRVGEDLEIR